MKEEVENNIKCPKKDCQHKWFTRSELKRVSCPSCLSKVENPMFRRADKL